MNDTPIRADAIVPENVEWLWRDRIPKAMFSMIAGRPDVGKSMIATVIAADVTKAGGNVLYSSKERSAGLMEWPRFMAAGGVQDRMHYWRFSLPRDLDELHQHIIDHSIDLVVADPVSAHFVGVSKRSDKIREVLNPLEELAEQTGCAFLFIEHALKRVAANAHPLTAIEGNSSGLPAACAMAYLFGNNPTDEERKVLACVKHNICEGRKAVQFDLDTVELPGIDAPQPTLVWGDEIAIDPMSLLHKVETGRIGRPNDKSAAAAEWLTKYLAQAGGPVPSRVVQEDGKHYGITGRTLRRVAQQIGIVREGGGPKTTWALPPDVLAAHGDTKPAVKIEDESANFDAELDDFLRKLNGDNHESA